MNLEQAKSVQIYFIDPIDDISIIINSLISMEYEAYTINDYDKLMLLKLLEENQRNVVFICIKHKPEIDIWFEYVKSIKKNQNSFTQICAFVFDRMDKFARNKFLMEGVAVIEFSDILKNPLEIMKKILLFFEAKGKRPYIKTETYGVCDAFFNFPNLKDPIIGKIKNISAFAFTCEIQPVNTRHFEVGMYLADVLLVLNGKRLKTALKIIGYNKDKPYIFMFKFCTQSSIDKGGLFIDQVSAETKKKVHEYLRWCLKEKITIKLRSAR
jgi:hypothetical protein